MSRYKHYDYTQTQMVPLSFAEQLMSGALEYAIHEVIENRMDLSVFAERYKNYKTGRKAYSPATMLKLTLLGYSRGKKKVNIQWLLYCIVHNLEKIAHYGQSYAPATA